MAFVETQPQDDTTFIEYVEAVVGQIASLRPPGIYITRIDGWFGERWLGFSGKILGVAGVHYREDFDIPPFVPNRVVATRFLKSTPSIYEPAAPPQQLHITQRSEANLRRKIAALVPADALVWFSSESRREGRGSILAYVPNGGKHEAWFVELARNGEWRIIKSVGISPRELTVAGRA